MMDALPPFSRAALLLDMDGTLLDIAPTPDSVVVESGLPEALTTLRNGLAGALAIVSGRPIEAVDQFLGDAPGAVAGEHGGAIRYRRGEQIERPNLPTPPEAWLDSAAGLVGQYPGALLERKARGFALHYRLAPAAKEAFLAAVTNFVTERPDFEVHPAHMLWEIRPVGVDKGAAVAKLMAQEPFAGRLPIFIGDDVTDEDGMRVARHFGGAGYRVDATFGTPAGVRSWLKRSAQRGDWADFGAGT